jgi:hypothetical protein
MLSSRLLLSRLLLLLLLFVAPSLMVGRFGGMERLDISRGADMSSEESELESELDPRHLEELASLTSRTSTRRERAPRPEASRGVLPVSFALVADLRPVRLPSPVPLPPLRRPIRRLLN